MQALVKYNNTEVYDARLGFKRDNLPPWVLGFVPHLTHTHIILVYTLLVLIAHSYLSVDLHYERN